MVVPNADPHPLGKDGFDFLGCHVRIVKSRCKGRPYLFGGRR